MNKPCQAGPEDEKMILELHLQNEKWLQSMGSTQWSGLLKGKDDHNLAGAIAQGEGFVFHEAGMKELVVYHHLTFTYTGKTDGFSIYEKLLPDLIE